MGELVVLKYGSKRVKYLDSIEHNFRSWELYTNKTRSQLITKQTFQVQPCK